MSSSHPDEAMMPPPSLVVGRRYGKQIKQGAEVALDCPRCDSPNTKFCYYNNYSFSQPRYFCKGCRRYWTKGGTLRDVPIGGSYRRSRRGKSSVRPAGDEIPSDHEWAFGHRLPGGGPLRPDMLLEIMVGNLANPGQAMHDVPAVADGFSIDLAMLYSDFLSYHQPAGGSVGVGAVTPPESAEHVFHKAFGAPGNPGFLAPRQYGFGEWSGQVSSTDPTSMITSTTTATTMQLCTATDIASAQAALGDPSFGMDQSCFDSSLGLPTEAAGNLSSWEEPKYDSLGSFADDPLSLHEAIHAADHAWSVDCRGLLEALYMP